MSQHISFFFLSLDRFLTLEFSFFFLLKVMSGNNDWFGKLKSRAKSVQESAKTSLVKLSDTVDKKLKEAQDDLERYEIMIFIFV